jgi:hypothetical protein
VGKLGMLKIARPTWEIAEVTMMWVRKKWMSVSDEYECVGGV